MRELRTVGAAMPHKHRAQAVEALHAFNMAAHEAEIALSHPEVES